MATTVVQLSSATALVGLKNQQARSVMAVRSFKVVELVWSGKVSYQVQRMPAVVRRSSRRSRSHEEKQEKQEL